MYIDRYMNESNEKYLLYIDILGFSNLVKETSEKLQELFSEIDNLNVHKHYAFKTVMFSDTILVWNITPPVSQHDHEYLIMYACEFVQDLLLRSIQLGIQFRAILISGEFQYEKMENIEAYHGKALISAYNKEKEIDAMGLFIDKKISRYNRHFASSDFDKDLKFVFLTKCIESFYSIREGLFPVDSFSVEQTDEFYNIPNEVKYLQILKENIDKQTDSKVRGKYLHTYHYYKVRYSNLISKLEEANFDYTILSPNAKWN